jgi:transmembrane sensor
MNTKASIELIIYKFFKGAANEDEVEKLLGWLTESNENRLHYFALKRIWLENKEISDKERIVDASWERLKLRTALQSVRRFKEERTSFINIRKLSVAATILILIGISSILGIKMNSILEYQKTTHEITVPLGSRTNTVLPDGTSVWLNADSKLIYTSDFGLKNRNVSLSGEAYFDVSPNKSSVFTVKTRDMNIRALGTQFNVKSYPEEDITETTLVSGSVEVLISEEGKRARTILLSPNQRIVYSSGTEEYLQHDLEIQDNDEVIIEDIPNKSEVPRLLVSNIIDTKEYTSWKDGRLTFRGESLEILVPKLERFYNVTISFNHDSIKNIHYTGTLEEVTIEEVMRAIARSSQIKFEIDKNQILLSKYD